MIVMSPSLLSGLCNSAPPLPLFDVGLLGYCCCVSNLAIFGKPPPFLPAPKLWPGLGTTIGSSSVLLPDISSSPTSLPDASLLDRGWAPPRSIITVVCAVARPLASILNVTEVLGLKLEVPEAVSEIAARLIPLPCLVGERRPLVLPLLYFPFPAKFAGGCSELRDTAGFKAGGRARLSVVARLTPGREPFT